MTDDVDPTLSVPEGFDQYDHDVKRMLLAQNDQATLRAAVDGVIGHTDDGNPANVTKEWLAVVLLALGGPSATPVDVEGTDGPF